MFAYMTHHLSEAAGRPNRRNFMKLSIGAGAGLVIGVHLPSPLGGTARAAAGDAAFTPFVRIAADDTVTVLSKHLDKGQGTATGLATLVAEELDAAISQVKVEFAPANTALYKNLFFGIQGTGGSTAIANSFGQYRQAGATARAMLVSAAAKKWNVPADSVSVEAGLVRHVESGRKARFGELAEKAATLPVPEKVPLKAPDKWVYIGKHFPRVDVANKTVGAPGTYGMDVQMDNMLVATLTRPPRWGGKLRSFDATKAKAVNGVVDVIAVPQGVVVLAKSTWPAIKARKLLSIDWDFSQADSRSTGELMAEHRALADKPGLEGHNSGDVVAGLAKATKTVEATYEFPYLAHAPMEPIDITILYEGDRVTMWTGCQFQTFDQGAAAKVLGLPVEKVFINTLWAGGSFGRRAIYDSHFAAEVAEIAKAWGKPQPIKLVYTREDDIKGGYYRPMFVHKVRAGLDDEGNIVGWLQRAVGQSIFTGTAFESVLVMKNGVDHASIEGSADNTYAMEAFRMESHNTKVGVPVLWWRSVGHSHNAYVMETMIDRLAREAGADPVAFRLKLLKKDPRKSAVLKLAAEKAGWGKPLPKGRHRGVAVHKSFNTYVAQAIEISMGKDGAFKVEKVVAAVDCGIAVNPDNIRAQIEGGIGYGLGAILHDQITLTNGEVDQANFDTYESLRIDEMPEIEVHIVASSEAPTGIGEPGVPPIGAAVANAIFAATGKTITKLPILKSGGTAS